MRLPQSLGARSIACLTIVSSLTAGGRLHAATLPPGFSEALVASGLTSPTAMQFAPDGRLFVCEQAGKLRVIKNGVLLSTPFLTVNVSSVGERGLLGVAFDPAFATNRYVYIYYTATSPNVHNRISRFSANGDVAVAGSEVVLLDLEPLSATNHNGGALHFGPDGKLYVAVGDNAVGSNAQSMNNLLGKILRMNRDGSIPTDNPFYTTAIGRNRLIWALGLRNPFTFALNPGGIGMRINDVGQGTWEEINDGAAGANYGWPHTEGMTTDTRFASPRSVYGHTGGACAIAGGAFYSPATGQFPGDYLNDYFFADYCAGWIRKLDAAGGVVSGFASGIPSPVDLKVGDDGMLYYLARGTGGSSGAVYRIRYGSSAPTITSQPVSKTVPPGTAVTFSARASGTGVLRYQWQRNGVNISGATAMDYTIASVAQTDNGARFRASVSNDFGNVLSNEAILTVSTNTAPSPTITQPIAGTLYSGGSTISYAGTGVDVEDGTLPASAFTWRVDFHHDSHIHPFLAPRSGSRSGSFAIPTTGETSPNVWYRIHLTVRDSAGATRSVYRDVLPRKVQLTLATSPSGLQLRLDGQPVSTPITVTSVVGITRTLEAPATLTSSAATHDFAWWSDAGARVHKIATPGSSTTYTATYHAVSGGPNGLTATYFDNIDFSGATVRRVDATVNFGWGGGSPAAGIGIDTFSARWTAQIVPQFTESYTFYTQSDDGVRLWVNGQQLISRWTNHALTEDRGTVSLVAGKRYDLRLEFYENTGAATIRLLWSSPSTPKAVVPTSRLFAQATSTTIRINFQPASAPLPLGYLADTGLMYGVRGNGQTYGWNGDNRAQTRDRNSAGAPNQAYDTLSYMQSQAIPNAVWEIAVPNGAYKVRVVAGDPSYFTSTLRIAVEGVLTVNGTTTSSTPWLEVTRTITVSDGRLTITNATGAVRNKLCFVQITPQ